MLVLANRYKNIALLVMIILFLLPLQVYSSDEKIFKVSFGFKVPIECALNAMKDIEIFKEISHSKNRIKFTADGIKGELYYGNRQQFSDYELIVLREQTYDFDETYISEMVMMKISDKCGPNTFAR